MEYFNHIYKANAKDFPPAKLDLLLLTSGPHCYTDNAIHFSQPPLPYQCKKKGIKIHLHGHEKKMFAMLKIIHILSSTNDSDQAFILTPM